MPGIEVKNIVYFDFEVRDHFWAKLPISSPNAADMELQKNIPEHSCYRTFKRLLGRCRAFWSSWNDHYRVQVAKRFTEFLFRYTNGKYGMTALGLRLLHRSRNT